MDRSLDDVINARTQRRGAPRGGRAGGGDRRPTRYNDYPRDGVRKSGPRPSDRNLDDEWVHDKFEGDRFSNGAATRNPPQLDRYVPYDDRREGSSATVRVTNLHYEVQEDQLKHLFEDLGPVKSCSILYDRRDRSSGTAYVTYFEERDAHRAVRDYDGQNARGQRISVQIARERGDRGRGYEGRSLFDRIDDGSRDNLAPRARDSARRRPRSASPMAIENGGDVDRYRPPRDDRSRPRRGEGRRPGERRGGRGGGRGSTRDADGHAIVGGRPRKTADELDAEMDDYFAGGAAVTAEADTRGNAVVAVPPAAAADGDIDMVE